MQSLADTKTKPRTKQLLNNGKDLLTCAALDPFACLADIQGPGQKHTHRCTHMQAQANKQTHKHIWPIVNASGYFGLVIDGQSWTCEFPPHLDLRRRSTDPKKNIKEIGQQIHADRVVQLTYPSSRQAGFPTHIFRYQCIKARLHQFTYLNADNDWQAKEGQFKDMPKESKEQKILTLLTDSVATVSGICWIVRKTTAQGNAHI